MNQPPDGSIASRFSRPLFLAAALGPGLFARVALVDYGDVFDVHAWKWAIEAIDKGSLYANTDAYNYGPIWGYLLWLMQSAARRVAPDSVATAHLAATLFLSAVDAINAAILYRAYGLRAAAIYYYSPPTILVSGFYCQFYGLGLLPGLVAFLLLERRGSEDPVGRVAAAALLLGVSLAIKHFLIFYPLWLFLDRRKPIRARIALATIPYAIFLGSFLPFAGEPKAVRSIIKNVFQFESHGLHALMPQLLELVVPVPLLEAIYAGLDWVPVFHGVKLVWALLMLLTGWAVMRRRPEESLFFYLVAMVAFTPMLIEIYLVIPVAACAVLRKHAAAWIYLVVASFLLYCNFAWRASGSDALTSLVNAWVPWRVENPDMVRAQVWLLVLLVSALRAGAATSDSTGPEPSRGTGSSPCPPPGP